MKTLRLDVDKELAHEYCEQYRQLFPNQVTELNDTALLKAFVEDRLYEELKFVSNELALNS
jgi:hypothetical protein